MEPNFFFYDLETSGLKPSEARIMQFAGQRTDLNLKPMGEPVNVLIKLTPDVLPDPDAILLTGITPQQTLRQGITEAAFLNLFYEQIALPNTIFVGFNNVRFDDEFIRFLNYRNFYDAYAWSWADSRSRWDILDLVRMTRALRPTGINWPFKEGQPINRLEELTKANNLEHTSAHDALSDVRATIAVARLIQERQPRLFNYLLTMRSKQAVAQLVDQNRPFVYTSSHYSSDYLHTTVVVRLAEHPNPGASLVYDLRHDPTPFLAMTPKALAKIWRYNEDKTALRLPVKTLKYNRVPAVAPLSVMSDETTLERLNLNLATVQQHFKILETAKAEFAKKLTEAINILDKVREDNRVALDVDSSLYDGGFINNIDRNIFSDIHEVSPETLDEFRLKLNDKRLKRLLPLYKARNFPESLNKTEQAAWQDFCVNKINSGGKSSRLNKYLARVNELSEKPMTKQQYSLLDDLRAYAEMLG